MISLHSLQSEIGVHLLNGELTQLSTLFASLYVLYFTILLTICENYKRFNHKSNAALAPLSSYAQIWITQTAYKNSQDMTFSHKVEKTEGAFFHFYIQLFSADATIALKIL